MDSGGVYNALNCNGLISAYSYIKVADIQLVYIVNNFLPRVRWEEWCHTQRLYDKYEAIAGS